MGFFDADNTNKNKTRNTIVASSAVDVLSTATVSNNTGTTFSPVDTWAEDEVYIKCKNNTKNNLVANGLREDSEADEAGAETSETTAILLHDAPTAPDAISPSCLLCQHSYIDASSFGCDAAYHCSRNIGKSIMEDLAGTTCCNMFTGALSSTLQQRLRR